MFRRPNSKPSRSICRTDVAVRAPPASVRFFATHIDSDLCNLRRWHRRRDVFLGHLSDQIGRHPVVMISLSIVSAAAIVFYFRKQHRLVISSTHFDRPRRRYCVGARLPPGLLSLSPAEIVPLRVKSRLPRAIRCRSTIRENQSNGLANSAYLKSAGSFRSVVQIPHASGMPTMSQ